MEGGELQMNCLREESYSEASEEASIGQRICFPSSIVGCRCPQEAKMYLVLASVTVPSTSQLILPFNLHKSLMGKIN